MEHINTRTGLSPDQFKNAFRRHATGVDAITADDGSGPVAFTATSVISVSAEPRLLVFSLSGLSSSTPLITASRSIVVHRLGASRVELAMLASAKNADRFTDSVAWHRLPTGEPVNEGVPNWIRGEIVDSTRPADPPSSRCSPSRRGWMAPASREPVDALRPHLTPHRRAFSAGWLTRPHPVTRPRAA